jgi:DNA-binding transcriptional MocR family regulator
MFQAQSAFHDSTNALIAEGRSRRGCSSFEEAAHVRTLQEVLTPLHFEGSPRGTSHGGKPAVDQFPYDVWARLIARRARQSLRQVAQYQSPAGYFPLREAIATQIGITRGVQCTPEQVILTAGSQGAIDLANGRAPRQGANEQPE